MEFCLLVTMFGKGIVYYEAKCFRTHAETVEWIKKKDRKGEDFLARWCDRKQLQKDYRLILEVE